MSAGRETDQAGARTEEPLAVRGGAGRSTAAGRIAQEPGRTQVPYRAIAPCPYRLPGVSWNRTPCSRSVPASPAVETSARDLGNITSKWLSPGWFQFRAGSGPTYRSGRARNRPRSIKPLKCASAVRAIVRSLRRTPASMLRSSAASVRFAEVTNRDSSSATTAFA